MSTQTFSGTVISMVSGRLERNMIEMRDTAPRGAHRTTAFISRSPRRATVAALTLAMMAVLAVVSVGVGSSAASTARSAGTISLSETGHLHLTSHHGFTLNEQGTASGSISGTIYVHLNLVSTNHVTAEVSIYPSGSSITGKASASYRPAGRVATFSGTMTVLRGTGRYAHAHGTGLAFSGTIQRVNDALTVHVTGRMST
jgi:hypothetical protein